MLSSSFWDIHLNTSVLNLQLLAWIHKDFWMCVCFAILDPVQTSNFTCAELNARVKCMWSATFESIKFDCLN